MSWSIPDNFVSNYHSQLELQFQQFGSRLRATVDSVTQNGEYEYYDRIGTVTANPMTTRHGDTPLDDITHTRRRNQTLGYNHALLFDNQDRLRTIIQPTSGYARSQAAALGRQMDSAIIAAATGLAYGGKTGQTPPGGIVYDSTYQILSTYDESIAGGVGAASNLTIGKLRRARFLLESNEAISDGEVVTAVITSSQMQSLLRSVEVGSVDYNPVRSLYNGIVTEFMGFQFVRTQLLAKTGDVRSCLVYPKSAIKLGVAEDTKLRITERDDKNYSVQVYSEATFGATRMWEEKVIEILCNETV